MGSLQLLASLQRLPKQTRKFQVVAESPKISWAQQDHGKNAENSIAYHTIPYHTIPHHITPYHITPYHTTPYHITPYHITPYYITPYHITPYHTRTKLRLKNVRGLGSLCRKLTQDFNIYDMIFALPVNGIVARAFSFLLFLSFAFQTFHQWQASSSWCLSQSQRDRGQHLTSPS